MTMPFRVCVCPLVVALLALSGTLAGSFFAHRRSTALIAYRIEQLEAKVAAHNNLVERTYRLEEQEAVLAERIRVANHRIDDLERG